MTPMKTVTVPGATIAKCREAAGLTQLQLGEKLGVGQSTVAHWEAGRRSPSARLFNPLCVALGVTRQQLLAGVDDHEAGAA